VTRAGSARLRIVAALLLAFVGATVARADSWVLPTTEIYASATGAARLTVTPRAPSSQRAYFEDRVRGRQPAGRRPGSRQASARGRLERRGANGRWTIVWEGPLVNAVAPVDALVADAGEHVVTFDNWHSVGWGDSVVVIYDRAGRVVRSLGLSDLLPALYIEALPHSTSSIHWGRGHRISPDGARLILRVAIPTSGLSTEPDHVELEVMLADGRLVPPAGPAWERALALAGEAHAAQAAGRARQLAFITSPLTGPSTIQERDWHRYLEEAFFRLDPEWNGGYPNKIVLRAPQAADYGLSLPWLREGLRDLVVPDTLMIASPDQDNLAEVLAVEVPRLPPGALRGIRLYVAADDARWPRFAAILAPTGARLVQLDPVEPIPQRAERLRAFTRGAETP
jgi:hypothetical protein